MNQRKFVQAGTMNAKLAPTGRAGATPGLAAIVSRTTFNPAAPEIGLVQVSRSREPEGFDMTEEEQDALAARGQSTTRRAEQRDAQIYRERVASGALVTKSRRRAVRASQAERASNELVAAANGDPLIQIYRMRPKGLKPDPIRYGETVGSIALRSTINAMVPPSQRAKLGTPVRRKRVQPAIIVRNFATNRHGQKQYAQTIGSIARRSMGLPR